MGPVALALVFAAAPVRMVHAAGSRAATASPEDGEPDIQEVRRLHEEGRARYETLDYEGAIELWTKAYARVPKDEANREIRINLVYNIASAQEKAYEVDGDIAHLRRAKGLLERYLEEFKLIYERTPETEAEFDKVKVRIDELQTQIREAESRAPQAGETEAATPPPSAEPRPQTTKERARERKLEIRRLLREDPELAPRYRSGKGMIAGGSVLIGVGALAVLIGAAYGFGEPLRDIGPEKRRRRRVGGISTLAIGAGMVAGGAVMVGFGAKRRKQAIEEAEKRASVAFFPVYDGGRWGGGVAVRF